MKAKGQVRLRKRRIKGGGWSLYLDIYHAGMRRYEYLRLYLNEERTPEDRLHNSETLRLAEAVRARRNIELQRLGAAMPMPSDKTVAVLLGEYLATRKERSEGTQEVWRCWVNRVNEWKGVAVSLKDISTDWWYRYSEWVREQGFAPATVHHYLTRMRSVLNKAEREGLIVLNPSKSTHISTIKQAERVYLTADELRQLKAFFNKDSDIQRAFLFACFCGLRYSDLRALRWEDIQQGRIVKRIVKTRKVEYLDLNSQAIALLGERGSGLVFNLGKDMKRVEQELRRWAQTSGLSKDITFHTSRHTFAVLMLSAGVDIYTLSRLLGHSSVTTTQIYADIVDARRREAVDMFPQI